MTRALVLGATGHIGAHIVRALLAEGHTVRAAYRSERFLHVLDALPVERVRVDLASLEGLPEALDGCRWVFHAAGDYPGPRERRDEAVARAVRTTRRVLQSFRQAAPARIVFTSSAATIRRVPGRLATEQDAEPWPSEERRPLYATVKIAMEHEVRQAVGEGLPVVIVNPSVCIGEYDAHCFSGRAVLLFATHRLPCYLDCVLNAVYTGDVGIGHVRAAQRGGIGERYLLAGRNVALRDFAALVARKAGVAPPRWRVPYRLAISAAAASELMARLTGGEPLLPRSAIHTARQGPGLDAAKARTELALPQTPLEDAVARALAWFKSHGYL
jgi:dihydroflavonol-4-reductase